VISTTEHAFSDNEGTLDFAALWRIAWSYKVLIAIVTLVSALIAVVLSLTATQIFRAEVVVTEVPDVGMGTAASSLANQLGGLASLAGMSLPAATTAQSQQAQAVLASRRLVEEFVTRNNLLPELSRNAREPPTLWRAIEGFRKGVMKVEQDKRNGVTTVMIDWTDPDTAAKWANAVVALANELLRARALADSSRNIEYLNKQIAKTNVLEVQRAMYNLIERETKTLMLANAREEYAFMVVDPAVAPEQRISPKRKLIVMLGLAGGGALGLLIAFSLHAYRSRRQQAA
jgi:uncharacterized protein involved in exopolysaccharide biosynthesis